MLSFIKNRKAIIIIIAVLVVVVFATIKINSNGAVATVSPISGDLIRTVKISGKVIPAQSVNLGFETSGTISSITKDVGDTVNKGEVIARIDASGIASNILKAEADLALAQANLEKLGGTGVYQAQIESAKKTLVQTIIDAYSSAEDAVYNKTDQFFIDPDSSRPEMIATFTGYSDLREKITTGRHSMNEVLDKWKIVTANFTSSNYTEAKLSQSKSYLAEVTNYIADVTRATTLFEVSNAVSQTSIDSYRADAQVARNSLNTASQNLITAEDKLQSLLLDVPSQVASVEAARATLLNYQSQLSKTALISPISGIVSKQDAKIGQVISSGTNVVSVISAGFEVEAFVPEVLISGVRVGNPASVTLDAYGPRELLDAIIIHLDPAETIRDGVSTYKIRLSFNESDERIRSGMTANVTIETFRKNTVVLIPERTVIVEDSQTFIYILRGENKQKTSVTIGERDSSGNVELLTDLPPESKLIINPTGK